MQRHSKKYGNTVWLDGISRPGQGYDGDCGVDLGKVKPGGTDFRAGDEVV